MAKLNSQVLIGITSSSLWKALSQLYTQWLKPDGVVEPNKRSRHEKGTFYLSRTPSLYLPAHPR